tara:strand:+ start:1045 stop:1668 length:624 start_codon:yes stop_codon:yes gene_type:complete
MKHITIICTLLFLSIQLLAQGTITGISISPPNPTVSDQVEIHVGVQFNSGNCELDNQGHNTNGFAVSGYAHHCVGLLTVICPTTDTFQLGQLPAGDYTFNFSLTSGFGEPSCSPGIVVDDVGQFQFTVSSPVGIDEISLDPNFAYPNPVSDILFLKKSLNQLAFITDIRGVEIIKIPAVSNQVDLSHLPNGIYLLHTESNWFRFVKN